MNEALREEQRSLGDAIEEAQPGVYRLGGLQFAACALETDALAELGEPVLSLVSRVFLEHRARIIEELTRTGHVPLLSYMLQQVRQFRVSGEGFAMQHKDSEYLRETEDELLTAVLANAPAEKIVRRATEDDLLTAVLANVPAEKIVRRATEDDLLTAVLANVPAEKIVRRATEDDLLTAVLANAPAEKIVRRATEDDLLTAVLANAPAEKIVRALRRTTF